ncbi:cilia- and flagella-associated protein 410 isoform X1 [Zerene cesonia]|uniref:cilia- and flagella-associated protein 410 isoform X1 n=1 Tax=Zerene cesonia TaxID=33412 RepID=UPI0018E5A133|nr:cilia- and flagella-associated protein 410 isoform X1 [Zerene cesonia]
MARLTEEMVIARSKQSDLSAIKKLNCWGAELGDVSLLRRMPNVEVLAFSINKIRTLGDFAACRRLRELYVRKNEIRDLAEIRHLRHLPDLTSLWLDENPCTLHPEYRMTVLRNLPNLEKLDNVAVHPEEVQEAMRRGVHIPDSDDEGYPQQHDTYSQCRSQRSCESSPEREPDQFYRAQRLDQVHNSDGSVEEAPEPRSPTAPQCPLSPLGRAASPEDERYEHPAMTSSHYEPRGPRSPDAASLRHSVSAHSVKDYAYSNSNGEWRQYGAAPHEPAERADRGSSRSDTYSVREWERPERAERGERSEPRARERSEREYPSAVMGERRGFTRRPVARNSNLLSAVLCLVKELDYPSLEVAEMAVRCRMDELANSQ